MTEIQNASVPEEVVNASSPIPVQVEEVREEIWQRLERKDRFLENPPSKPKEEIADMLAASLRTLVPRRFKNLANVLEAVRQGYEIVIRSEHLKEYAGAAGLLASYTLSAEKMAKGKQFCAEKGSEIDWNYFYENFTSLNVRTHVENKIFGSIETTDQKTFEENLKKMSLPDVRHYCELLGLDVDEFYKGISYSYWEKIGGLNRSIIADSAVIGRYHILSKNTDGACFHNYCIVDSGQIVFDKPNPLTGELKNGLEEVIAFYERIRNAEGFNPAHCPLIEFQTHEARNYFLQYHRTRDMDPCAWRLKRGLEENEFKAAFVRGATPPEGIILDVTMYYPRGGYTVQDAEDGSFDFHYDRIFSEIMSRRRILNFNTLDLLKLVHSCVVDHLPKSKLFNPKISISIPYGNLPQGLIKKLLKQTRETGNPARVKTRVVSDGREAYVKFLE